MDAEDNAVWDQSDEAFTIRPQLILSAPNGAEYLTVYNLYSILWSATAEVSQVVLDYSIDAGVNWLPIQSSAYSASTGRYNWIVPNTPSSECLVRLRNFQNSAVFDVSDAVFSITVLAQPPVADFEADICSGFQSLPVQFTDQSIAGAGNITSWLWDFGNGDSSIEQNPLYVYDDPGLFSVTLTVSNSVGLTDELTMEDYIEVIPREPEIEVNPESSLAFGNVYLGSVSDTQTLWIKNIGTADLVLESLSFEQNPSVFATVGASFPLTIEEGDSLAISLIFTPQVAGSAQDSLYIHNNSINAPLYAISLRGTGEYVPPKAPENLQTDMNGVDMVISWDAVTQTIFNTPIEPDFYLVFYNGSPDEDSEYYFFHGATTGLSYTHQR